MLVLLIRSFIGLVTSNEIYYSSQSVKTVYDDQIFLYR